MMTAKDLAAKLGLYTAENGFLDGSYGFHGEWRDHNALMLAGAEAVLERYGDHFDPERHVEAARGIISAANNTRSHDAGVDAPTALKQEIMTKVTPYEAALGARAFLELARG